MDTTPPSQSSARPKSTSRLSKLRHYRGSPIPHLCLDIVPSPSPKLSPPKTTSPNPRPPYTLPLQELMMLSPSRSSPLRKSKTRLAERLDVGEDGAIEPFGLRKRCKNRSSMASPRSNRRSRRKLDQEEILGGEDVSVKPKKKRHSEKARKDKSISSSKPTSLRTVDGDGLNLDAIGEFICDLVMWKDVSKSSLWFGFGSLCFLSSCFARGVNFSFFSFISRVGFLVLGVSFLLNSVRKRDGTETSHDLKLNEDDILRVGRLILPAANLAISKTRRVFSGEPAMTLKVVPILLVGAEYGHLITLWRLCALGFFISFTAPKLYCAYSSQLSKKVEYVRAWAMDAWGSCTHKRIVAASFVTAFWNLTPIRARIFAAFLCLVLLRYHRQQTEVATVEEEIIEEGKQDKALVAEEIIEEGKQDKALVAVEIESNK